MTLPDIKDLIEKSLAKYVTEKDCFEIDLLKSMNYSLLAGGKRIRAIMVCEFCRLCGGDVLNAIPFACALEMIHTYSLIHDDLPCMDNDDMRRGKPANHVVFGEDIALLSGDALLTLAFEIIFSDEVVKRVGFEVPCRAAKVLAKRAGMFGMIGGQIMDIQNHGDNVGIDRLRKMHEKKTGALICAAAEIGCIVANASEDETTFAIDYAKNLGLAFQIMDDVLDVVSSSETIGKPVNSDNANNKSTYASLFGIERSKELVSELTCKALESLDNFDSDIFYLKQLALDLSRRTT